MNIQDTNYIPEVLEALDEVMRYTVEVGVLSSQSDDEILMRAFVNEYGATIEGVRIPERSFMRSGFDNRVQQIYDKLDWMVAEVVDLNITAYDMYNALGGELAGLIQDYLTDISHPPNAPQTVEQKGSTNPLVDTGQLRQSITWQVVER